ncbi:acyl-CoA dehydrogenase [Citrobacter amalonaticus]|uniref:Acyl-CoA dehydrogenase n=1 Tax=Citrobacter amalonaticus TaxID=35703 RepID=A0A2S4S1V6_CITAM|nr:acyl-CoA dehydrogenase [Citrobacter amalonaticus]POT59255.1 acyl-CoA dehydrogenase [Citrobacter amalonaticus]POT77385.1 acyl-CoA dehydrogenase [Citrobacter amalonaticus]POU67837.1 acyl-CoA dehydrogenase [Citrobacter amalonaticus]POV07441.1 acyl-CoA dehydrogenase [Citrobacter amalonaticus]
MNRKLIALLMVAITLPAAATQYVKSGAVLTLNPAEDNAEFSVNASTEDGSGVCNMDGTAKPIDAGENQKRRWVWNDNASPCVAVFGEMNNGKASVMTRGCEGYCGASATGTMDGLFNPKS